MLPSFVVRGRSSNEGIMAASLSLTNDHRAVVAPTLGRLEEQQQQWIEHEVGRPSLESGDHMISFDSIYV